MNSHAQYSKYRSTSIHAHLTSSITILLFGQRWPGSTLLLAGVWARVGVVRSVWGCGDMAPPTRTVPYPCPQIHIIRDDGESVKLKKIRFADVWHF